MCVYTNTCECPNKPGDSRLHIAYHKTCMIHVTDATKRRLTQRCLHAATSLACSSQCRSKAFPLESWGRRFPSATKPWLRQSATVASRLATSGLMKRQSETRRLYKVGMLQAQRTDLDPECVPPAGRSRRTRQANSRVRKGCRRVGYPEKCTGSPGDARRTPAWVSEAATIPLEPFLRSRTTKPACRWTAHCSSEMPPRVST